MINQSRLNLNTGFTIPLKPVTIEICSIINGKDCSESRKCQILSLIITRKKQDCNFISFFFLRVGCRFLESGVKMR